MIKQILKCLLIMILHLLSSPGPTMTSLSSVLEVLTNSTTALSYARARMMKASLPLQDHLITNSAARALDKLEFSA
jgi:hypothetical protein